MHTKLHALCLRVTEPGGLYCAASCTAQVSPEAFRETLGDAAERAKVDFYLVHDAGRRFDHPIRAAHPEGRLEVHGRARARSRLDRVPVTEFDQIA